MDDVTSLKAGGRFTYEETGHFFPQTPNHNSGEGGEEGIFSFHAGGENVT